MKAAIVFILFLLLSFTPTNNQAQTKWFKYSGSPVLERGATGEWDDKDVIDAYILWDSTTYHMWYGTDDGDGIGYATSLDGIFWEKYPNNPVLEGGATGEWDTKIRPTTILFDGTHYKMYYYGWSNSVLTSKTGLATSPDGINWTKDTLNNPILSSGGAGSWDSYAAWGGIVIYENSSYKMWYHGGANDHNWKIGYAESEDGIVWTKHLEPVIEQDVNETRPYAACPFVIFEDNQYSMWYWCAHTNYRDSQFNYATSTDGLEWNKSENNPILSCGISGTWDDDNIWKPFVIKEGDLYKMWYSGTSTRDYSIGYATSTPAQTGSIESVMIHSQALENNFLADSPDKDVNIYLPPDYEENSVIRYPVIYLLHGYGRDHDSWFPSGAYGMDIKTILDTLITQGIIQQMIVVMPNAFNKYYGSFYTDSDVTGNWEEFITKDLIEYIDQNYRTLPQAASRGIAGHSMGGYGAFKIAMKHSDKFCVVYAHAPFTCFEDVVLGTMKSYLLSAVNVDNSSDFGGLEWQEQAMVSAAVAFAPNTNGTPFCGDFPINKKGVLIDSNWARWLQHDPLTMIELHKSNLLQLKSISIECGTEDGYFYNANVHLSLALNELNIPHLFKKYSGTHSSNLPERIEEYMLPFLSDILVDSLIASAVIHDRPTPNNFTMTQNYPNPFNPSTTLKYEIPKESYITLKVYDILGRKVATLVNEQQKAGYYEVDWNAVNNSSGVYFYQIRAGDPASSAGQGFVETKKMILLR